MPNDRSGEEHPVSGCDVLHLLYGGLGGQHRLVLDLAAGFARVGLRSGAIAYGPAAELIPVDGWPGLAPVHLVPKRRRLDLMGSRAIRRILERTGARALLWHSSYAPLGVRAALRGGRLATAVLVEHQSVDLRPLGENLRSLTGMLVAPRTVVLSEAFRQNHPLRLLRLAGLRTAAVISNGVDTTLFRPAERHRDPVGPVRLIVVGRLVTSREVEVAVEAALLLAGRGLEVSLDIVGDGSARPALERFASVRVGPGVPSPTVNFVGQVPAGHVADRLRAADTYLHPSRGEARSTALLQAWATGLPVVAARVAGIDDLVRDGEDGLLVPPSDPVSMADAVQRLLDDPALAVGLGTKGRTRAFSDFSIGATVRGYLEVLAEADDAGPWAYALARVSQ